MILNKNKRVRYFVEYDDIHICAEWCDTLKEARDAAERYSQFGPIIWAMVAINPDFMESKPDALD